MGLLNKNKNGKIRVNNFLQIKTFIRREKQIRILQQTFFLFQKSQGPSMNSRFKKQANSYEKHEKVIQKHLNDDFGVHEYLAQNNLNGDNIGDYSKLFNTMLVTKNQKRKKFDCLQVNYNQMLDQNDNQSEIVTVQMLEQAHANFCQAYSQIEIKTSIQDTVKDTLHKQIIEIKKSINLLTGDIGHLVDRNQSAKLLESKISKVKIVADDQLKRVSLAYLKDNEQIKIRNDMQKNFAKKIKSINMYEESTLKRMKKTYLDTMVKKKQIHDRLSDIQIVNSSIYASEEKGKQTNQNIKKIIDMFKCFKKLSHLINAVGNTEQIITNDSENVEKFLQWFNAYTKTQLYTEKQQCEQKQHESIRPASTRFPTESSQIFDLQNNAEISLKDFQSLVVKQFARITEQIDAKTDQYNFIVKKRESLIGYQELLESEVQKLQTQLYKQAGLQYSLTYQMKEDNCKKMKHFTSILKSIFVFLQFIEKKLNYSNPSLITQTNDPKKYSQTCLQFLSYRNSICNNISDSFKIPNQQNSPSHPNIPYPKEQVVIPTNDYASQLYSIHCALMSDDCLDEHVIGQQSVDVHKFLQTDIKIWLKSIKESVLQGRLQSLRPPRYQSYLMSLIKLSNESKKKKKTRMMLSSSQKTRRPIDELNPDQLKEETDYHLETFQKHHKAHHSCDITNSKQQLTHSKVKKARLCNSVGRNLNENRNKIVNLAKLNNQNSTQPTIEQAQRIQLLQNVDMHYYKMIKSTLKMEKENTRKNYLFLKNFKRAKYSSRDSLLEQKRYEVSFSMLFAAKKDENCQKRNFQEQNKKFFPRMSLFSKLGSQQKRSSRKIDYQLTGESENNLKLPDLTLAQSQNTMKQMRENFRKLRPYNNSLHGIQNKSSFSDCMEKY